MAHTPSGDRFSALPGTTHHGVDSEPDTYMLDGDDFDVNVKTGFLPPQPPLIRLTPQYEIWEQTLDDASSLQLKLGERNDLTEKDRMESATWRRVVEEVNNAQYCNVNAGSPLILVRCLFSPRIISQDPKFCLEGPTMCSHSPCTSTSIPNHRPHPVQRSTSLSPFRFRFCKCARALHSPRSCPTQTTYSITGLSAIPNHHPRHP